MPYIELTRNQRALVDEDDFVVLSKTKWHAHKDMQMGYFRACRHVPGTKNKTIEMSYDILGFKEGGVIDHKNRNTLDYRKENLRWATRQDNSRNRIRPSKIHPGVFKNGNLFSARITIEKGVRKFLGSFKTPEEAGQAYKQATINYFGEFSPYANAI